jgi:hypothetical protein
MSSAIDKFIKAMNNTSLFWDKKVELIAKHGEVVCVKCDGFHFVGDEHDKPKME